MDYSDSKRSQIRAEMRQKRRQLSAAQQSRAAELLYQRACTDADFVDRQFLALYLAADGEIDPGIIMEKAHALGKHCYLPVVPSNSKDHLIFVRWLPGCTLRPNKLGIPEPDYDASSIIAPQELDTVFMPLVAFDQQGTRLGMGMAFYDRTFAFTKQQALGGFPRKNPRLVGLAHEIQRLEKLESASWDIPLNKIITDQSTYVIGQNSAKGL